MIKVSPSLLSADFSNLSHEVRDITSAGADMLHLDVMDGMFVPNITFGAPVIKAIRPCSDIVFDVHLMINEPIRYIDDFIKAGADIITVHYEATDRVRETLEYIRSKNIKAGLSIKPKTSPDVVNEFLDCVDIILIMTVEPGFGGQSLIASALDNVRYVKNAINKSRFDIVIEADGGIKASNVKTVVDAGVDIVVAGSAVFGANDYAKAICEIKTSASQQ